MNIALRSATTKIMAFFVAFACGTLAAKAEVTTLTFRPDPVDMYDLDHHDAYTWKISHLDPSLTYTSATLTILNIANWDSNPNMLFIHLLDTAKNSGVAIFEDEPANAVPVNHIDDDFVDTRYHSDPNWLVAPGTADTFLTSKSFSMTPTTFVYNFTSAQVAALNAYAQNNNNFALGLDPDCHFFNDGFSLTLSAIPEVPTFAPLGGILLLVVGLHIWRSRRQGARPTAA